MPLSINKLESLLSQYGYAVSKYYVNKGMCMFIELISFSSADIFLLYIPTKYDFVVNNKKNIYTVNYLDFYTEDDDNVADNYGEELPQTDIQNTYNEVDLDLTPDKNKTIEDNLNNKYRRPITLKDISSVDLKDIRSLKRQLGRLKYCVQGLEYKICILYKNYICVIRRDDTIDCLIINGYTRTNLRKKLYIITDLEVFYEKPNKISLDIKTVREGIYNVLSKNQKTHSGVITSLLEDKKNIDKILQTSKTQRKNLSKYSKELDNMLEIMIESERKAVEQIFDIHNNQKSKGLYTDTEKSFRLSKLNKELENIRRIKKEIIGNMLSISDKQQDLLLSVDNLMFDNCVMTDTIIKNFKQLKKFI